jgi:hypothetical protein
MARKITAGVLLDLKDQFSSKIQGAGISVQGFADKAIGVANKVNQAFSGVAGTLGTLGVSIGALGAVKSTIDLDDRMVRLGLTANAGAREVNALKRRIFETAQMPDIKLDTDSIISGLEVVMTKVGDLRFVEDNVRNIALAIQASGESGEAMGAVFAEFAKFGYTMEEILPLMDDLIAQGDQGAFTFGEFAKNAPAVFSAYSAIGTTPEHIRKANAAMQILMAGTKSADIAVTALNSAMAELSDPDKKEKLRMLGITVRDSNGDFRDFNDIMFDIVAKAGEMGNADFFGTIFGTTSMNAVRAYMTQGGRMYESLVNLGDTAGLLEQKSAAMADTLKSNLQNLQTAFLSFADKNLTGPLRDITSLLNKLAEDPEKIEDAIRNITITLGLLAGVRIGAGIISLVANLNSLKSGGGLNLSGLTNAGGGAGIPVHVTNWGGSGGGPPGFSGPPTTGSGGLVDQYGRPLASGPGITHPPALSATGGRGQQVLTAGKAAMRSPKTIATGVGAGLTAALYEIPEMLDEIHDIERDEILSDKEKGEAKGGAIGDASGSIVGAAGGAIAGGVLAAMATSALAGTAIGTAIPGLGNIAGLIIGAGIGAAGYYFGGKAGRAVGSAIGGAVAGDDEAAVQSPGTIYNNSVTIYPGITPESPGIAPAYAPALSGTGLPRTYPEWTYPAASPGLPDVSFNTTNTANATTDTEKTYWVNDLIVTPRGQFSTHPDDYIFAMKNPAALVNDNMRREIRTIERILPAIPPVVVEGEIELRSELAIDDKGYRLRQSVGKNTTPYKFAVGSAKNARLIQ